VDGAPRRPCPPKGLARCSPAGRTGACAGCLCRLPVPYLVCLFVERWNPGAGNGLDATLQGQPGETAFSQVFLYGIHGHATFHQSTDVAMELRRLLLLPVAKGEWGLPPGEYRIVDGMALQQHHEVSPGTSHGAGKPQDGVVLFLGGG